MVVVLGAFTAGLIARLSSPVSQGVSNVMEAVALGNVRLSFRTTIRRVSCSWIAIATGMSIGREGPLIEFGGSLGATVARLFGQPLLRVRILVAAGTAAGFAAAYNTPFAAVLFVLETIVGIVAMEALLPTMVATLIATAITRAIVGGGPIYGQRSFVANSPVELASFAVLGVVAAVAAFAFKHLLGSRGTVGGRASASTTHTRDPRGPLRWCHRHVGAGSGGERIRAAELPARRTDDGENGARAGAGEGRGNEQCRRLGDSWRRVHPDAARRRRNGNAVGASSHVDWRRIATDPGSYALVGMAATTAASIHAPLTAAVLVFELSGDYPIVLPLILATVVATSLSRGLGGLSIYEAELQRKGVHWTVSLDGRQIRKSHKRPRSGS